MSQLIEAFETARGLLVEGARVFSGDGVNVLMKSAIKTQLVTLAVYALVALRCAVDLLFILTWFLSTRGLVVLQLVLVALFSYVVYFPPGWLAPVITGLASVWQPGIFAFVWFMVFAVTLSILPQRLLSVMRFAKAFFDLAWIAAALFLLTQSVF